MTREPNNTVFLLQGTKCPADLPVCTLPTRNNTYNLGLCSHFLSVDLENLGFHRTAKSPQQALKTLQCFIWK